MVVSSNLRNRILWYISRLCSEFFEYLKEKESAKEKGRNEAVLMNIVAHLEKLDQKFDSRLTEYDTKFGDFSQGLLDTIGDTVKTTVEERLRVLGVSNSSQPEGQHVMVSEDNQQPDPKTANRKRPLIKANLGRIWQMILLKLMRKVVRDKAAGVKKNLDSAFGNADATNADLVSGSPGKEPPFGRGCRGLGKRNNLAADLERNEAELKKKQKQEEAELKRKKKQEEAELKKKQKKEETELKKKKKQEETELNKKKKQEEADLKKKKKQEEADSKKDIPASKRTRSDSGNNASLMTIASTLDKLSRKFDLMDARFKKPLVDQKSIDDMVKVAVEERLKVMGIGKNPQNKDNVSNVAADQQPEPLSSPQPNTQQKFVCSPLLAETPGKDMGPRNNLSNELDKERGMKKTLAKEFGTHAEDEGANVLDFLYVSPAKATKAEDLRRRSTRNRTIKDEDAEDKKKAQQAEAGLKRKEKAAAKRKAAASMKQKQAELKNQEQAKLMNEEQAKKWKTPRLSANAFIDLDDALRPKRSWMELRAARSTTTA
ncbi:hypothetical protein HID58_002423 [Brassica napus]|uniref:Uncharacterized protein n=2 Tax=Brassica TaxID=3705 RepID=A0ABQ8EQ83_BRANA|nr:hypothetical protein HID58_002423 [Brassica napus]